MDYNWNAATLRRQIMSSSSELRALESKLHACAVAHDNSAAVAEREAQKKMMKTRDKQYAELLGQLDSEERMTTNIINAEKYAKMLETQRVLKEQIAEKAASKAKAEAEETLAMLSEVDEDKVMKKERDELLKRKQESHEFTRQFLLKQSQFKKLQQKEEEYLERRHARTAEEYNLKMELQKELERQKEEMKRLQLNTRELAMVKQLEKEQHKKEIIRDARLELEVMEKQAQEKLLAEENQRRVEAAKLSLKEEWDSQLQYKQEQITKEQEKEAEYKNLLLEVLDEEAQLDKLVSEARKRRQLDHRLLVDRLLKERRAMRATIMKQHQEENQYAYQYEKLRKNILEEEEKQLLLRHAPQLTRHFTPELLSRLRQLL